MAKELWEEAWEVYVEENPSVLEKGNAAITKQVFEDAFNQGIEASVDLAEF